MRTLASLAGYLMIDNRCNEGVPDEIMVAHGFPVGSGRGLFEEDVYTCSHCEVNVMKNRERTRPRGYCKGCEHVICDACDAKRHNSAHQCIPFKAFCEEIRNAAEMGAADPVAVAKFHFLGKITA